MNDSSEKKQLGRILLRQKLVSAEGLEQLLDRQKRDPSRRLGAVAVETGALDEVDLLRALSEQHGLPGIDLAQVVIPVENLRLVPQDIARQYLILPFSVKDDRLFLAMADPSDRRVVEEIEFVTGRTVHPYVAAQAALQRVIEDAYRVLGEGLEYYVGPQAPDEYLTELGLAPEAEAEAAVVDDVDSAFDAMTTSGPSTGPSAHGGSATGALRMDGGSTAPPPLVRQTPRKLPTLDPAFGSRVAPLPAAPGPGGAASRVGRTVLIVDDEDDIRRMLRKVLTDRGIVVVEASRGTEALQAVREHDPDVVLLDAMLPEIHGFDICRRIKASRKYGHVPVIMVSAVYRGWRFAQDLKESYGVYEYLEKPFKISEVVQLVELALDGKSPDEENEELTPEAVEHLSKGIEAYRSGELDDAIDHLSKGVAVDPTAFRLHYHLGLLYGRRDQLFEGIQSLETAVELSARNFSALKNLAVLYQRAGFKHKAVEMWERAMGTAPDEETRRGIKDHLLSLL